MTTTIGKCLASACGMLALSLMPVQPAGAADAITREALPRVLSDLLRDNPDIVLDVLRNNSEAVLEIAQEGSNLRRRRNLEAQWKLDMDSPKKVALNDRPVLGKASAKVRIVAFSDFTCTYCQQASHTLESLLRQYGDKTCLVFKHLPQDTKGISGMASAYFIAIAMQDEAKAWKFYRILYAEREKLVSEGAEYLKRKAQSLDVDMKRLEKDIKGKKVADIMAEDEADAQKLGVEGTPHFLVNNIVVKGSLPLDLFRVAVDMALERK